MRLRECLDIGAAEDFHARPPPPQVRAAARRCRRSGSDPASPHRSASRPSVAGSVISPVRAAATAVSGRHQIHLGVRCAAAALKVAVEGPQAHAAGVGRKAHADAGAAGAFQQPCAGGQNVGQRAAVCQHGQHLPGAGGHGQADRRVRRFCPSAWRRPSAYRTGRNWCRSRCRPDPPWCLAGCRTVTTLSGDVGAGNQGFQRRPDRCAMTSSYTASGSAAEGQ